MAGLELSGVAEVLEEWIVDDVQIVRDNGYSDDALDTETLELTPAAATWVYQGKGLVQRHGDGYRMLLPLDADAEVIEGDMARVVAVHGYTVDPQLTDRVFRVGDQAGVNSLAVAQALDLEQVDKPFPSLPEPNNP